MEKLTAKLFCVSQSHTGGNDGVGDDCDSLHDNIDEEPQSQCMIAQLESRDLGRDNVAQWGPADAETTSHESKHGHDGDLKVRCDH